MTPLTVAEARAILLADEALQLSYEARLTAGQTFGIEEREAWAKLVESASERIAAFEGQRAELTRQASPGDRQRVLVHADGGACHGTMLVDWQCPTCGIAPDMQSCELWPREVAKRFTRKGFERTVADRKDKP